MSGTNLNSFPTRLDRLTSLRALAALFVFGYHLQLYRVVLGGRAPLTYGYAGVSFFFILSGFVLTWATPDANQPAAFWRRRFARIYPVYAVLLVVCALLSFPGAPTYNSIGALASVLLVQSWSLSPHVIFAVNPPSWSLSDEAFFYLVLPLLLPALSKLRATWRTGLLGSWFILTGAVVVYGAHRGGHWSALAYTFPLVRSGEFFLGVLLALELRRGRRLPPMAGVALIAGGLILGRPLSSLGPIPDVWLDPLWVTVIVLAAQQDITGRPGWILTRPAAVYAGGISYAFYLIHQIVVADLAQTLGGGVPVALLALLVATAGAVACHHLIERPVRRLLSAQAGRGST